MSQTVETKPPGHDTPITEQPPTPEAEAVPEYPTIGQIIEKIRELWPSKGRCPMFSRARLGQREAHKELLAFIESPTPEAEALAEHPTREEIIRKIQRYRPGDDVLSAGNMPNTQAGLEAQRVICDDLLDFIDPPPTPDMTFGEAVAAVCAGGVVASRRDPQSVVLIHKGTEDGCVYTSNFNECDTTATDWMLSQDTR